MAAPTGDATPDRLDAKSYDTMAVDVAKKPKELYRYNAELFSYFNNPSKARDTFTVVRSTSNVSGVINHVYTADRGQTLTVQFGGPSGGRTEPIGTVARQNPVKDGAAQARIDAFIDREAGEVAGLISPTPGGSLVAIYPRGPATKGPKKYVGFDGNEHLPPPNPVLVGVLTTDILPESKNIELEVYIIGEHFQPKAVKYVVPVGSHLTVDRGVPLLNESIAKALVTAGVTTGPELTTDPAGKKADPLAAGTVATGQTNTDGSAVVVSFDQWYTTNIKDVVFPDDGGVGDAYGKAVTNPFLRGYARGTDFSEQNLVALLGNLRATGRTDPGGSLEATYNAVYQMHLRLYGTTPAAPTPAPGDTLGEQLDAARAAAADAATAAKDAQAELTEARGQILTGGLDGAQIRALLDRNQALDARVKALVVENRALAADNLALRAQLSKGGGGAPPPVVVPSVPTGPGVPTPDDAAEIARLQSRVQQLAVEKVSLASTGGSADRIAQIDRELALLRARILSLQDAVRV